MNKNNNSINTFNVIMAVSIYLNKAITCCAILECFHELENDNEYGNLFDNDFMKQSYIAISEELLLNISRIYDNKRKKQCSIEMINECIYKENDYIYDKDIKKKISKDKSSLYSMYSQLYKDDRNNRLAHANYDTLFSFSEYSIDLSKTEDFLNRTKIFIEYLLSINKDYLELSDISKEKTKYLSEFNKLLVCESKMILS